MTHGPITTTPDATLADAAALLVRFRIGCLPVVDGARPAGRDLLRDRRAARADLGQGGAERPAAGTRARPRASGRGAARRARAALPHSSSACRPPSASCREERTAARRIDQRGARAPHDGALGGGAAGCARGPPARGDRSRAGARRARPARPLRDVRERDPRRAAARAARRGSLRALRLGNPAKCAR